MAVPGKGARAEEHHNADDEHDKHSYEDEIGALAMHGLERCCAFLRIGDRRLPACNRRQLADDIPVRQAAEHHRQAACAPRKVSYPAHSHSLTFFALATVLFGIKSFWPIFSLWG